MARHAKPGGPQEDISLEMVMEMAQGIPGAVVSPIMPGSEVMDDDFEPEHLNEDELKLMAGPINRASVYNATHGDLEMAKLAYGWIETSDDEDQKRLRYNVLQHLCQLHVSLDAVMEAADWIAVAPTFEQRQRRLQVLVEHHTHNEHEITLSLAEAARWIEG